VALDEPVWYPVDDVPALAAKPVQSRQDVVGERAEGVAK